MTSPGADAGAHRATASGAGGTTAPGADQAVPPVTLATVGTGLVLAALPAFLVGGLAPQIRADLAFGDAALGAVVSAAFMVGALAAPLAGRLTDRIGARSAILVGAGCSVVSATGIAVLAHDWVTLLAFLAIAGLAFAFMDPGLGLVVARTVPRRRQGLAFGVKEAAVPGATLVAGLAIPAIVVAFGWRWAFVLVAVPLVVLLTLLAGSNRHDTRLRRPPPRDPTIPPGTTPPRRLLLAIAVAAGLGSTAASGISVFLTESSRAAGLSESGAGLLLAAGSIAGIVTRVGVGVRADRHPGSQLGLMTVMVAVGAVAMLVGALGSGPALVVGTVGAFAAGWGWSGLLFLTLVTLSPDAPGAATGIGLSGLAVGNALGPLGFGLVAQAASYTAAWLLAAVLAGGAAILFAAVARSSATAEA